VAPHLQLSDDARMPRLVSLLGLGFGDCGKGLFTDFLARTWQADAVVRFNGGAQAGHNVVLPDGRHHTFSQFGAATFVPGVATVLACPVVVHPTALLVENAALCKAGVTDALGRLLIDGHCRITTPFLQSAGRLRELQRGALAHGTCGVGVGETIRHALEHGDEVLHYGELNRPALALEKLQAQRQRALAEFGAVQGACASSAAWQAELRLLQDEAVPARWLAQAQLLLRQCPPASGEQIAAQLSRSKVVLFEGAQGVLLDEWHGFHPHTSWSTIHPSAVRAVASGYGLTGSIENLGVLRSYLTRHGAGPLPTHDAALDTLAEPHNTGDGWQGSFRRGHADAVLLRYALSVTGPLDGILLSHLDVFESGRLAQGLKWCDAYDVQLPAGDVSVCQRNAKGEVTRLLPCNGQDLLHASALTALLLQAQPVFAPDVVRSAAQAIGRVEDAAGCPVTHGAFGPTHETVRHLRQR
jgi:adenylosuccinate synthase